MSAKITVFVSGQRQQQRWGYDNGSQKIYVLAIKTVFCEMHVQSLTDGQGRGKGGDNNCDLDHWPIHQKSSFFIICLSEVRSLRAGNCLTHLRIKMYR